MLGPTFFGILFSSYLSFSLSFLFIIHHWSQVGGRNFYDIKWKELSNESWNHGSSRPLVINLKLTERLLVQILIFVPAQLFSDRSIVSVSTLQELIFWFGRAGQRRAVECLTVMWSQFKEFSFPRSNGNFPVLPWQVMSRVLPLGFNLQHETHPVQH